MVAQNTMRTYRANQIRFYFICALPSGIASDCYPDLMSQKWFDLWTYIYTSLRIDVRRIAFYDVLRGLPTSIMPSHVHIYIYSTGPTCLAMDQCVAFVHFISCFVRKLSRFIFSFIPFPGFTYSFVDYCDGSTLVGTLLPNGFLFNVNFHESDSSRALQHF